MRVVQGCTIAVEQSRCTMQRPKRPHFDTPPHFRSLNEWGYTFYVLVGGRTRNLRVVQGCTMAVAQSRYARMHNDSHTKPLHDATAQMAVDAQMQRPQRPHFDIPRYSFARSTSRVLFLVLGRGDGGVTIPPSWRQKSLQYKNGGRIASKCIMLRLVPCRQATSL